MNKQQFIKAFADKANFTQKDAGIAFDAMVATIADTLKGGDKIQIAGFGAPHRHHPQRPAEPAGADVPAHFDGGADDPSGDRRVQGGGDPFLEGGKRRF